MRRSASRGGRRDDVARIAETVEAQQPLRRRLGQPLAEKPALADEAVLADKPAVAGTGGAPSSSPRADIPLPERRPAELAQPQMVWPAGQSGQRRCRRRCTRPPPSWRHGRHPAAADAAGRRRPKWRLDAGPAEVAAIAPPPTPVLRPAAPILASASAGLSGSAAPRHRAPCGEALGYADAESPLQPACRRGTSASALIATKFERLDFASVAAPVDSSHDPAQSGLTRPDLDSVGTLIPKPRQMVVMRFGVAAYQDLRAEKFAGVAIKPLRTASFAVAPELFTRALAAN